MWFCTSHFRTRSGEEPGGLPGLCLSFSALHLVSQEESSGVGSMGPAGGGLWQVSPMGSWVHRSFSVAGVWEV